MQLGRVHAVQFFHHMQQAILQIISIHRKIFKMNCSIRAVEDIDPYQWLDWKITFLPHESGLIPAQSSL